MNRTPSKIKSSPGNTTTNIRRNSLSPSRSITKSKIDVRKAILEASKTNTINDKNDNEDNNINHNHNIHDNIETLHDENIRLTNLLDNYKKKMNKLIDEIESLKELKNINEKLVDENKELNILIEDSSDVIRQLNEKYNKEKQNNYELKLILNDLMKKEEERKLINKSNINETLNIKQLQLEQSLKLITENLCDKLLIIENQLEDNDIIHAMKSSEPLPNPYSSTKGWVKRNRRKTVDQTISVTDDYMFGKPSTRIDLSNDIIDEEQNEIEEESDDDNDNDEDMNDDNIINEDDIENEDEDADNIEDDINNNNNNEEDIMNDNDKDD